ncbi:MAG: hypothetical protein GY862_19425 [Gammaproteobacteria bacterium]|nr:hypothetical protein [Gammaproteobacteria bacterium]
MQADTQLKNKRIVIRLDRLHVENYPGTGIHHILFSFYARNSVEGDQEEHLHYTVTVQGREGQSAAVAGLPLFIGLNVGANGVDFKCATINVCNEGSQKALKALESDAFKSGLKLATKAQPALAPLAGLAQGFAKAILTSNDNVTVQKFHLGLDFDRAATGVRLAPGTYIVAQVPASLDWNQWFWHRDSAQIRKRDDPDQHLPHNYLMFRISPYSE